MATLDLRPRSEGLVADTWRHASTHAGLLSLVAAAVLGSAWITRRSLSTDEAVAVERARVPFGDLVDRAVEHDPGSLGYLALLQPLSRVDDAEWVLRAPSVAGAALSALAGYALARVLFGRLAGVIAALALALNAGVVAASQQVRPLTLAILAILVSTLVLVLALERSPAWWLAYVPACALLSLTHPLAATVVAAHAVAAVLALRERRSSPGAAIAGLAFGAAAAAPPTLAFVADRANGGDGLDAGAVVTGIGRAGGWNVALLVLAVAGLAVLLTRRLAGPAWKAALVTGLVAAPILATLVSAVFLPVFPERALVVCAPGLALACAAAVAWIPDRDAALGAAAILVVFALPGLVAWYTRPAAEDWRSAVRAVSREAASDETVVVLPERSRAALAYYAPEVAVSSRARGRGAWVLIRSRDDRQAIRTARRIVRTPAYALLAQTRFGERLVLQHWVRP